MGLGGGVGCELVSGPRAVCAALLEACLTRDGDCLATVSGHARAPGTSISALGSSYLPPRNRNAFEASCAGPATSVIPCTLKVVGRWASPELHTCLSWPG